MLYRHDHIITKSASMLIHTNMKNVYDKRFSEKED